MENGESLLDVIDETSDLFGNNDVAQFDWADEILAENEADVTGSVATEHGNIAASVIPSNVIMTSQNYITSSSPSQTFTIASQHPFLSSSATNSSELQQHHGASLVGPTVVNPVQNVAQSMATQLFQQGNQQFILKTAGGHLQLTTQGQLQLQQPVLQSGIHASANQFQQPMAHSQTNRQSPALSASPMQNRSMTPSSVALPMSFVATPSSQTVSQLKSASPAPNVNILHLPQNLQQTQPQLHLAPGTVLQIPGAGGSQNLVNANLIQGLSTQQQGTLVNTQNTVIQNPNVVNLNVAHHMPLGVQTAPQAPFNIQGTLIQTPEGKSILIPSQNLAQAVNIQSLGQLSLPTQVAQTQNPNTVANMIKLQAAQVQGAQGTERSSQGISQLVLNHQGQQVLIQRAPSTGAQPQNIVVRSLPQSNIVQLQQTPQRTAQAPTTLQAISGQGQQLKFVQQGTSQGASNVSVNIGGQNVNLGQLQNLQFVQGTTTVSTATGQPDQTSQQQVTFQQGQGHDPGGSQQRQTMTSQAHMAQQQNVLTLNQQQNLSANTSQGQPNFSNSINIAEQNYKGLSNMQQLMQKLRGSKGVTLQTVTDPLTVQTSLSHTQPVIAKVTTVAPNVIKIKREKIDSVSGSENTNISSSGSNTIKNIMLQKQAGTLGTARIIVKQEPSVKIEPSSTTATCSFAPQAAAQSATSIERLLATSSAFTTAQVTAVTTTLSQSSSTSNNFVSDVQQTVPSTDIKVFASQSFAPQQNSDISALLNSPPSSFSFSQNSSSSIAAALNSSGVNSSVTSTTNSLSGNLSSISPRESTSSATPQVNSSEKPAGGATLQTIHLPPELQQNFQRVQAKIREVNSMKNISSVERQNKLQQLNMIQRKILLKGRVLATTRAEPHHIQKGLQVLASPSSEQSNVNVSNQPTTTVSQTPMLRSLAAGQTSLTSSQQSVIPGQHPGTSGHQLVSAGQQTFTSQESALSGQQPVASGHQSVPHHSFLEAVDQSLQSSQPMSSLSSQEIIQNQFSVSKMNQSQSLSGGVMSVSSGQSAHMIITSSSTISSNYISSNSVNASMASIVSTMSNSIMTSVVSNSNIPSVVANGNMTVTVTSSNMTQIPSSIETGTSQSPSLTTDSSSMPGVDPNKAVPTQIKIGNKILTLNLTKLQKDKVQSYLDRMTPEQQQQYLQTQQGILNRIQRQQELNTQIQAQVEAQKQKQQLQSQQQQANAQKITVVTQKNIVTGKPLETPTSSSASPLPLPEVKVIPVPSTITANRLPTTDTMLRGQKRTLMDIPKGTLINQQLRQDQNLAVNPDVKKPFKTTSDACRRLLRYHVFQSHGPSEKDFQRFDYYMENVASDLLRKKDRMMDKFRLLMLQESMRLKPSAELVMLQRLQNQDLKKILEEEKNVAKTDPDSFIPMPMKYLMSESDGDTADEEIKQEPGSRDSSPCKTENTREKIKTEPVSDSDVSNEPDYKKMKTLVIRLDSRLNFQSSFKRNSLESRSSVEGSETVESDSTKDHMDTSQESDEEDADSVKTEIVDGDYVQEEIVQDEMIEEEIVTDYNTEECVTETRTEYSKPLIRTKASYKHFDSEPSQLLTEDESSKAILSISSAEESQADDGYDESAENSQNLSPPVFSQYTNDHEHRGNTELASESIYFNQVQSDIGSLNNTDQYSNDQGVQQTRKYIPEHSPVSNDSFDDNANPATEFNSSGYFDKFKMYQPITESLTDSEENSYYSADNTVEQNSVTVDDAENENVPWTQPPKSSKVHQYSDSEHSEDSDPEVKAQMESAINSILSLNQGAPDEPNPNDYNFSQSNPMFTNVATYQSEAGMSDSQSELRMDEMETELSAPITDDDTAASDDDDVVIVNDDIDAAVQSILM